MENVIKGNLEGYTVGSKILLFTKISKMVIPISEIKSMATNNDYSIIYLITGTAKYRFTLSPDKGNFNILYNFYLDN